MNTRFFPQPAYDLAQLVRQKFFEVRVLQTAGSLTYTTLLSLVPMVTVVLTVMRQFSPFMKLGEGMRGFLLQNLLPERAGKVVATYALQFSEKASSLTVVGSVFLVVTAIMLFATIDRTFASIWTVRRPRAWYVRIPVYWLALTLGPVLFAGSVAAGSQLLAISSGVVSEVAGGRMLLERAMTAILLSALFSFMFHVIPNRRLNLWHGIIGGLVAGIGVVLVQRLFGFYLSKLPNFTLIYGTFSVVPIFLIWVYLTWFVILLGATLAAVLPDFNARHRILPHTPSGRILVVIRLALALIEAQRQGLPVALQGLARACRETQARTEVMLEEMRQAGWVVRTDEGEWMLCVAAEAILLGDLMARVVVGVADEQSQAPGITPDDQRLLNATVGQMREAMARPVAMLAQIG
ncbi:YihY family inner membrane protein [Uliginosibacterium sp. 31-16]|uniref:YihY family inner membrane protein n=1 Tax=Uliginosibacterium sp. 31-16 TaxID=3068315 RepID=UPI00273E8AB0|nr:YihY family inner membrane protein [Uliginosibacterium sp. 31-16]MDP5241211.1 YihY family inner membrane protein [Uliginosibacterium sp. 31-16]